MASVEEEGFFFFFNLVSGNGCIALEWLNLADLWSAGYTYHCSNQFYCTIHSR